MNKIAWTRNTITSVRRAWMITQIAKYKPKDETEKRDLKICRYFLLDGLSAMAISRLGDPDIVCLGNRAKGKPLTGNTISVILKRRLGDEIGYKKRIVSDAEKIRIHV